MSGKTRKRRNRESDLNQDAFHKQAESEWDAWMASMTPEERAQAKKLGLDDAKTSLRTHSECSLDAPIESPTGETGDAERCFADVVPDTLAGTLADCRSTPGQDLSFRELLVAEGLPVENLNRVMGAFRAAVELGAMRRIADVADSVVETRLGKSPTGVAIARLAFGPVRTLAADAARIGVTRKALGMVETRLRKRLADETVDRWPLL